MFRNKYGIAKRDDCTNNIDKKIELYIIYYM